MKRTVYLDPAFKKKKPKKKVEPPKEGSDPQAPPVQPPKPRLSVRFKSRIGAPPPPLEVKLRIDTIQNERLGNPAAVREGDGRSGGGVCVSSWIVDPDKEEAGGAANHTVADATAVHYERN